MAHFPYFPNYSRTTLCAYHAQNKSNLQLHVTDLTFLSVLISGPIPLIFQSTLCAYYSQSKSVLATTLRKSVLSVRPLWMCRKSRLLSRFYVIVDQLSFSLWEIRSLRRNICFSRTHTAAYFFLLFLPSTLKSGGTNCPSVPPFRPLWCVCILYKE